jgi:hypothetical protein
MGKQVWVCSGPSGVTAVIPNEVRDLGKTEPPSINLKSFGWWINVGWCLAPQEFRFYAKLRVC